MSSGGCMQSSSDPADGEVSVEIYHRGTEGTENNRENNLKVILFSSVPSVPLW
jgi:hypothetical protein